LIFQGVLQNTSEEKLVIDNKNFQSCLHKDLLAGELLKNITLKNT